MEKPFEELVGRLDQKFFGMREYLEEVVRFYKEFITSESELENFLTKIYKLTSRPNKPRLMINNVMRLVSLADDVEKIRPGKDGLKVFFIVVCIETLFKIADIDIKKHKMVEEFFLKYVSDDDRDLILNNVKRSLADSKYQVARKKDETDQEYQLRRREEIDFTFNQQITIDIFARIISESRNTFTHEGDYWSFSFAKSDYPIQQFVKVEEKVNTGKRERVYEFEIEYDQFRMICVEGFLNIIETVISEEETSSNIV